MVGYTAAKLEVRFLICVLCFTPRFDGFLYFKIRSYKEMKLKHKNIYFKTMPEEPFKVYKSRLCLFLK